MFLCCVLKDFVKLLKGIIKIYAVLLSNDAVVYRFEQ